MLDLVKRYWVLWLPTAVVLTGLGVLTYGNLTFAILDQPSDALSPDQFRTRCAERGGAYRERIACGVVCLPYAECGFGRAWDADRLCWSGEATDRTRFDTCWACQYGAWRSQAPELVGTQRRYCNDFHRLERYYLKSPST